MVIYHGDTVEEAEAIFRTAVDDYLSDLEREGKAPPKPFASLPSNLSHELLLRAALFAQERQVDIESVLQNEHTDFLAHAQ
jgi:predicted HicB family RNase H-like nuclease